MAILVSNFPTLPGTGISKEAYFDDTGVVATSVETVFEEGKAFFNCGKLAEAAQR